MPELSHAISGYPSPLGRINPCSVLGEVPLQRLRRRRRYVEDAVEQLGVVNIPLLGVVVPHYQGYDLVVVADETAQLARHRALEGRQHVQVLFLGDGEEIAHRRATAVAGEQLEALHR